MATGVALTSTSNLIISVFNDYEPAFAAGQGLNSWASSSKPKSEFGDIDLINITLNGTPTDVVRYQYEGDTNFVVNNNGTMTIPDSLTLGVVMIDSINSVSVIDITDLYNKLNAIL